MTVASTVTSCANGLAFALVTATKPAQAAQQKKVHIMTQPVATYAGTVHALEVAMLASELPHVGAGKR